MYLTVDEENELERHLLQASEIGYRKKQGMISIKCIVECYLKDNGRLRSPSLSDDWWTSSCKDILTFVFVQVSPLLG